MHVCAAVQVGATHLIDNNTAALRTGTERGPNTYTDIWSAAVVCEVEMMSFDAQHFSKVPRVCVHLYRCEHLK